VLTAIGPMSVVKSEFLTVRLITVSPLSRRVLYIYVWQCSKWDGMRRYAIPALLGVRQTISALFAKKNSITVAYAFLPKIMRFTYWGTVILFV
jgi:hypothetical protein